MWQDIETCPKDGKPFLAAATYVMDEYDEDQRLIAKGKIVREPCLCYWLTLGDFWGGADGVPPQRLRHEPDVYALAPAARPSATLT